MVRTGDASKLDEVDSVLNASRFSENLGQAKVRLSLKKESISKKLASIESDINARNKMNEAVSDVDTEQIRAFKINNRSAQITAVRRQMRSILEELALP